jgi:hypothetical protein
MKKIAFHFYFFLANEMTSIVMTYPVDRHRVLIWMYEETKSIRVAAKGGSADALRPKVAKLAESASQLLNVG